MAASDFVDPSTIQDERPSAPSRIGPRPTAVTHDIKRGAGMFDIAVSSLAEDPQAKIRFFAKKRGIPESRYSVINGKIAYQDDDGNWYAEIPGSQAGLPSIPGRVAAGVGPAIPVTAAAATGIATAPMSLTGPAGLAGSMGLTGLAASGGEAAREYLAKRVMDQEMDPWRIAKEGGTAALGQGLGAAFGYAAKSSRAADINQLDRPTAAALRRKAELEGITLTPAEETGLSSLRAQQKYLGNVPSSQNTMQQFYEGRNQDIGRATERYLGKLSPVDSAEVAGRQATQAAKGAVTNARTEYGKAVAPYYDRAKYGAGGIPNKVPQEAVAGKAIDKINELLDVTPENSALRKVRDLFFQKDKAGDVVMRGGQPVLKTRVDQLHEVKTTIDDILESQEIGSNAARLIREVKDEVVESLGKASPVYDMGRKAAKGLYPNRAMITEGMTDLIAKTKPENYGKVAQKIFGQGSGPDTIRFVRAELQRQNPEAWNAIKRSWLQDMIEKSSDEFASAYGQVPNTAGKTSAALGGKVSVMRRMQAALEPSEFKALQDLRDVLRAAGSVKPIGSDTEWNRLLVEAETAKARPLVAKIMRNINPAQALRSSEEWLTQKSMQGNAQKMAEIITQPRSADTLRELKKLPPSSIRFRILLGHLLTQGGAFGAGEFVDPSGPSQNQ